MLRSTLLLLLLCGWAVSLSAATSGNKAGEGKATFVPLRPVVKWLSAGMQYDAGKKQFTITTHGQTVQLTIGALTAQVNGKVVNIPVRSSRNRVPP